MPETTVEGKIADALLTKLGTLALTPTLPVAYPNVAFDVPSGPYLDASILPNTTFGMFVGEHSTRRYLGILQVTAVYPTGIGVVGPMETAGKIAAFFARFTKIAAAGLRIDIYETPSVAPPLQEAARIRVPVSIPYRVFV